MEARGEGGDGGKEKIIWKEDESGGEKTTVLSTWVSEERNRDRKKESPRKLSAVGQKWASFIS